MSKVGIELRCQRCGHQSHIFMAYGTLEEPYLNLTVPMKVITNETKFDLSDGRILCGSCIKDKRELDKALNLKEEEARKKHRQEEERLNKQRWKEYEDFWKTTIS